VVDYAVEMHHVSKQFPLVIANDDVTFSVQKGEIHALVGENGAGKSTLMNILYGLFHADSGTITVRERTSIFLGPVMPSPTALEWSISILCSSRR